MNTLTVLTGLCAGAIASLLCLLFREHKLLNLSAAGWVILGGWISLLIAPPGLGGVRFAQWPILVLLAICLLQALTLYFLRGRVIKHPAVYLFLSFGFFLLINYFGSNHLQGSGVSTLPYDVSPKRRIILIAICIIIPIGVVVFQRSKRYAKHIILLRSNPDAREVWVFAATLQMLQTLTLVALGIVSGEIHKGHFRAGNALMIVTSLAVLASAGRPIIAFFLTLGLSFFELLLHRSVTLSDVAQPLSIFAFAVLTLLVRRAWPILPLRHPNLWLNGSAPPLKEEVLKQAWFVGLAGAILLIATHTFRGQDLLIFSFQAALVQGFIVYLGLKHFAIQTATWPIFGAAAVYATVHLSNGPTFGTALFLLLMLGVCAAYTLTVRLLSPALALLADLTITVTLFDFFSVSQALSGAQNSISIGKLANFMGSPVQASWALFFMLLALSMAGIWLQTSQGGRLIVNIASDPWHAVRHGISPGAVNAFVGAALLVLTTIIACIDSGVYKSISPDRLNPVIGITALFIGHIMATQTLSRGLLAVVALILAPPLLFNTYGELREAMLGALLIFIVIYDEKRLSLWIKQA